MTTRSPNRPVLRYHGGKWRLAPWIISHFPAHQVYVEPFGGAASVLMRKPRAYAEVYNDRWGDIVEVFRLLRDLEQAARLTEAITLTPFAREEFEAIDDASLCATGHQARLADCGRSRPGTDLCAGSPRWPSCGPRSSSTGGEP